MSQIEEHRVVQAAAKNVLVQLQATLSSSELGTEYCHSSQANARGLWNYPKPGTTTVRPLVLAGPRTCLSLSGKDYEPSDDKIGTTNLVTVDLSLSSGRGVGRLQRGVSSLKLGVAVRHPQNPEFIRGRESRLNVLHANLLTFATPATTFEDLCEYASSQMRLLGFL